MFPPNLLQGMWQAALSEHSLHLLQDSPPARSGRRLAQLGGTASRRQGGDSCGWELGELSGVGGRFRMGVKPDVSSWVWQKLKEVTVSVLSKSASDFGPQELGVSGGLLPEARSSTVLGIRFPLLILLMSRKVLNVIILPFSKQEGKK